MMEQKFVSKREWSTYICFRWTLKTLCLVKENNQKDNILYDSIYKKRLVYGMERVESEC